MFVAWSVRAVLGQWELLSSPLLFLIFWLKCLSFCLRYSTEWGALLVPDHVPAWSVVTLSSRVQECKAVSIVLQPKVALFIKCCASHKTTGALYADL